MWFVYLARCRDGSLYCGVARDVEQRIREHNESKRGAKYTRSRRPVKLAWSREVGSKSEALRLEASIKRLSKTAKERMVEDGEAGPTEEDAGLRER